MNSPLVVVVVAVVVVVCVSVFAKRHTLVSFFVAVDPYLESRHYRPEAAREADYKDELRRIRMKQQEETNLRAIEAAKERNEIKEKEKTRKNQIFDPKKQTNGTKLGRGNDYSPMQPWSGSTGSGRYKPAKRTVKRG
jgi:hypothetical protein